MKGISVYDWIVVVSRRLMLHGVQKSRVESCMHRHKFWVYLGKSAELTSVAQLYWRSRKWRGQHSVACIGMIHGQSAQSNSSISIIKQCSDAQSNNQNLSNDIHELGDINYRCARPLAIRTNKWRHKQSNKSQNMSHLFKVSTFSRWSGQSPGALTLNIILIDACCWVIYLYIVRSITLFCRQQLQAHSGASVFGKNSPASLKHAWPTIFWSISNKNLCFQWSSHGRGFFTYAVFAILYKPLILKFIHCGLNMCFLSTWELMEVNRSL